MAVGQLNTNQTWRALLGQVVHELALWGIEDYVLPIYNDSRKKGEVKLTLARNGTWTPMTCGEFGSNDLGARRNLCAIRETLRALRLADQRGIGGVFAAAAAKLLALPDPNDPYRILGVSREATREQIRAAYDQGIARFHPDRPGGNQETFKKIHEAARQLGVV